MPNEPKLDFAKIDYPSDKITIKDLRKLHPDQVDTDDSPTLFDPPLPTGKPRSTADHTIGTMLYTERLLAKMAFDGVLGRDTKDALFTLEEYAEELAASYIRYGVATGPHHAEQLVRGIETQASAQARAHTGRRP